MGRAQRFERKLEGFVGDTFARVFGGKVDGGARHPVGFDGAAAATAVRFNGFYLFQSADAPRA